MVVFQGSQGSICFYDKNDKICCSLPLTKLKTMEAYWKETNRIIIEGFKDGYDIQGVSRLMLECLQRLGSQKKYKRTRDDEYMICMNFLTLIKLKALDFDDVAMIFPKKRPKKRNKK